MIDAYHYVRFRWWTRLDLEKISKELAPKFDVKMLARPGEEREMTLLKDERDELEVKSDTLMALLSPFRVVLSQKESAPFSQKDMDLRKRVFDLYPRNRPTPFPWQFSTEPKFAEAEKK